MLKNFFCAAIFTSFSLTANITSFTYNDLEQGWNSDALAKMYFHHSELQRQWSWEALSKDSFSGDETILDFGCGDGKISAEMARLVKNGSVFGVDVSEKMLHLAKIHFPSYAFPNLTFHRSKSLTLADFPGKQDYDYVCAFSVFHLIANPLEILKNLKAHLKPSGKLLLVIPTGNNDTFLQAANETLSTYGFAAPWSKKGSSASPTMRTLEGSAFLLREAGYRIESLEIIDTDNPFYDLDDLISWMIGTVTANWQIPPNASQPFFTDLVHRMVQLNPNMIDAEGRVRFTMPRVQAIARPA